MYEAIQSESFLNDLVILPQAMQKRVPAVVRSIQQDPYRARGQAGKVLKQHFGNVYRVRLGNYRLLYAVGDGCVRLLALGPRDQIYNRFTPSGQGVPSLMPTLPGRDPRGDLPDGEVSPADAAQSAGTGPGGEPLFRKLLEQWGVPRAYHDRICRCENPEDIFALDLPPAIKARVLHWHRPATVDLVADEPGLELRDPEDLLRYTDGRLKQFLLRLDPEQERAASRNLLGPALVKGGPGTGKSLVALYRIRNLLEDGQGSLLDGGDRRVLLVTYTNSLVRASRELLDQLLGDRTDRAEVRSLDSMVHGIVTGAGEKYSPADHRKALGAVRDAVSELRRSGPESPGMSRALGLSPSYLLEEFKWVIEGRPISTLAEYLDEDRSGRGIRFDAATRRAVWEVHQKMLEKLRQDGLDTYERYRRRALDIMKSGRAGGRFDAVIVDEAQDLTPVGILLCLELCRSPSDLYMTADASQSIYSKGMSWKAVDRQLDVRGRTTILRYNYRSTRRIEAAARQVLGAAGDSETSESIPIREGSRPLLVACESLDEQAYAAGLFIQGQTRRLNLPAGAGAILVRTNSLAGAVAEKLSGYDLPARAVRSAEFNLGDSEIKVMTLHAAKGLEFPVVVVAGVDAGRIPAPIGGRDPGEREERLSEERRLLFVGLSRAMRGLALTFTDRKPSPFISDLDPGLWHRVRAGDIPAGGVF